MRLRSVRGFTLIELAIAVAILAIGAMAAFRTFDAAQRGVGGQLGRALAQEVALNRAAELRVMGMAAGRALPATVRQGRSDWHVEVREALTDGGLVEVEIVVGAPDQPGARVAAFVTPAAP